MIHAEARRGIAVDNDCGLQPPILLVGIDVAQFRQRTQLLQQQWRPVIQVI